MRERATRGRWFGFSLVLSLCSIDCRVVRVFGSIVNKQQRQSVPYSRRPLRLVEQIPLGLRASDQGKSAIASPPSHSTRETSPSSSSPLARSPPTPHHHSASVPSPYSPPSPPIPLLHSLHDQQKYRAPASAPSPFPSGLAILLQLPEEPSATSDQSRRRRLHRNRPSLNRRTRRTRPPPLLGRGSERVKEG